MLSSSKCPDGKVFDKETKRCRAKKTPGRKPASKSPKREVNRNRSGSKSPKREKKRSGSKSPKRAVKRSRSNHVKSPSEKVNTQLAENSKKHNEKELKTIRNRFKKFNVHFLNPEIIEKMKIKAGDTIDVVLGQVYDKVEPIMFTGFATNDEYSYYEKTADKPFKFFKSKFSSNDDIVLYNGSMDFGASHCHGYSESDNEPTGRYGTGSGCDTVFLVTPK